MNKIFVTAMIALVFFVSVSFVSAGSISISPWYPQQNNYVFKCNPDFPATHYDWSFGDGHKLIDLPFDNVYHTFNDGTYEVTCTAYGEGQSQRYVLRVQVGADDVVPNENVSADVKIAPWFPQGPNGRQYVFICDEDGFEATRYDFDFGDGEKLYDLPFDNVWHEYKSPGTYPVECTAYGDGITAQGEIQIIVDGIPEIPIEDLEANLTIAQFYPQGNDYVFICDVGGASVRDFTWFFGDGSKLVDSDRGNVFHTFQSSGLYEVECVAEVNDTTVLSDSIIVNVGGVPPINDTNDTEPPEPPANVSEIEANLNIAPFFPQGSAYVLVCDVEGASPVSYSWFFGDGAKLLDSSRKDVYHVYANGTYEAECVAKINSTLSVSDSLIINVGNVSEPPINDTNDTEPPEPPANVTEFSEIRVSKHICPTNISEGVFDGMSSVEKAATCLVSVLEEDSFVTENHAEKSTFDFEVDGLNIEDAQFVAVSLCETDFGSDMDQDGNISSETCYDMSYYSFNVSDGVYSVIESVSPKGTKDSKYFDLGLNDFDDWDAFISLVGSGIELNTSADSDGIISLHVYNFEEDEAPTNNSEQAEINIVNHLCPDGMSAEEFESVGGLAEKAYACPDTILEGDEYSNGVNAMKSEFDFRVGTLQIVDAEYNPGWACEDLVGVDFDFDGNISEETCMDLGTYTYHLDAGFVEVEETLEPEGYEFGEVIPNPGDSIIGVDGKVITLDTLGDSDKSVTLHVFNFKTEAV